MITLKSALRFFAPFGLIELHRRRLRLEGLGIRSSRYSSSELVEALEACNFELWPPELRQAPHDWALVDVGANVGGFAAAVLKLASPQQVIAIEPLPPCHSALASVLSSHRSHRLIKAAAGEVAGEIEMHFAGESTMSSVLSPLPAIAGCYRPGACATHARLKVPLVRIDDVVPPTTSIGIFKLDVQGFELSALRGAVATLQRTKAVLVEINYTPHYEGAASFDDVHGFLSARGFQLYGVSAPYLRGRPLWADAVYSKSE
jgi:FkbM family methyltransferase